MEFLNDLEEIKEFSLIRLLSIFNKMISLDIELSRTAEVAYICLKEGLSKKDPAISKIKHTISKSYDKNLHKRLGIRYLLSTLEFLSLFAGIKEIKKGVKELALHQNKNGGWGRFKGDISRIPVTWRVLEVCHNLSIKKNDLINRAINWLKKEWKKDMIQGGLSYKCAGILMANFFYKFNDRNFIGACTHWLFKDQNSDGGWSARKDAPIGSIPSYTSLAVCSLTLTDSAKYKRNIAIGIGWFKKNQFKKGLWKEHPPERGIIDFIKMCTYLKNENPETENKNHHKRYFNQ